jgi:hypothetical protein
MQPSPVTEVLQLYAALDTPSSPAGTYLAHHPLTGELAEATRVAQAARLRAFVQLGRSRNG